MAKELHVEGYEALIALIEKNASCKTERLFVLFCGSKDASGASWCPDCVKAEPEVKAALKELEDAEDLVLIHCAVGGRTFWKDQDNVFRTNARLKLKGVPTLLDWNQPEKRLVEENCAKKAMVMMLFKGDE